jgi:dTDP-4-dehydrorhamnose reductase
MPRILLFGKDGQLGQCLAGPLATVGEVTTLGRGEADFADPIAVRQAVRDLRPEIIVNAAAYTAVDKAEQEPETVMTVNALSVGVMGEAAAAIGARVLHYSTDYVFDGKKAAAYAETDATGPLNLYGESKLAGENALLGGGAQAVILRTSWVYATRGRNFVHTMLRLGGERSELRIVDDQVGAPTSAEDLAAATVKILQRWRQDSGVYHATAGGEVSWAGFAREIFRLAGMTPRVVPIPAAEYPTPAARPANSRLDCGKLLQDFGVSLPTWQDGLSRVMAEIAGTSRAE